MPWVKGQSGNPTGRKPKDRSFKGKLAEKVNLEKQVKRLLELAESKDESIALKAILAISDRLDGTPVQSLRAQISELPKVMIVGRDEELPEGAVEKVPEKERVPDCDINLRVVGHSGKRAV